MSQELDLDKDVELAKARERVRRLGIDLDNDLPDYPSAVLLQDFVPVRGSVLIGMGMTMPAKEMNRRFKK